MQRDVSSVGSERLLDRQEVTGSNPVRPTFALRSSSVGGLFCIKYFIEGVFLVLNNPVSMKLSQHLFDFSQGTGPVDEVNTCKDKKYGYKH